MSSNSEAVLLEHVRDLGMGCRRIPRRCCWSMSVTWAWKRSSKDKGWFNQGVIVFCTTCMPTQHTDDLLMQRFIRPHVGDDVVIVLLLRRLWFESCSGAMVEMKQSVLGPTEAATRGSRKQHVRGHCEYSDHPEHPFGKDELAGRDGAAEVGLAAHTGGVLSLSKHEDLRVALQSAKLEVAHKEFWNQLSLRAEEKVAATGGIKPLELYPGLLASWQFQACFMYLPALHGNAAASSPSNAPSPQSAAAGETPTPNPDMLTKAERNRKQLRQTTEAARADERGQWHNKRVPHTRGCRTRLYGDPRATIGNEVRLEDAHFVQSG